MNLKTFVKVGSITNLSDARFCAGFGVDQLGFDINPSSEHYVGIEQANEIMGWVAGPAFVAEVGDMDLAAIIAIQEEHKFPFLEVDDMDSAKALLDKGFQVMLRVVIDIRDSLSMLSNVLNSGLNLSSVLVECKATELIPEIEEILSSDSPLQLIKAYDVELSQLDHIIQIQPFDGIELKGSQEDKPGFKEYDELADILEALELED
ncbi:MAG: hypothetical protein ABJF11_14355 [Reichenbachiella sp.]|uniref:hypothetical protein n=1 Tax=Reichenbachiella sp. TaxID=2184521 RepID=UPI00326450E1